MKKYLIVYYSRTGTSKKAAGRLYELLGSDKADIEEIVDLKDRSGIWGWLVSCRDALSNNITSIEAVKNQPSNYLQTVVVTPIWAGKIADAIRTYLAAYNTDIKELTLVTCAGGQTGENAQKDILRRFALKSRLISLKWKEVSAGNIDGHFAEIVSDKDEREEGGLETET